MCMTFDDGRATDHTIAYPEMRARGVRGTSYLIGSRVSYDWNVWRRMWLDGWDVQCHSYVHVNLTNLTEAELHADIQTQNTKFVAERLPVPEHHAYPFGAYNATVRSVISEYRKTQRHTGYDLGSVMSWDEVEYDAIKSLHADITTEEKMTQIRDAIDLTKDETGILVTYTHSIVDEVTDSSQCLRVYFMEMLEYALSKGLRFVTISELYNLVRFHRLVYGGEAT